MKKMTRNITFIFCVFAVLLSSCSSRKPFRDNQQSVYNVADRRSPESAEYDKDISEAIREDILSDCIFVLRKLIDQYDPKLSYFSYFLSTRIDINLFRYAADKYFPKEELSDEDYFPEEYEDPFNKIDNVICIHQAMDQLSEKSKEVIQVYFFDGLDQKECAESLGITQGAFSKRLSKALEQMKLILGEDFLFD